MRDIVTCKRKNCAFGSNFSREIREKKEKRLLCKKAARLSDESLLYALIFEEYILGSALLTGLLEQGQNILRHSVCLREHGGSGLREDLVLGESGHFLGKITVADAALGCA